MRFHILGLAHTISTPEYTSCAFTQKVVKLCDMLSREGHEVYHYGHEASIVNAKHVTVVRQRNHELSYGIDWDWRKQGFPPHFSVNDHCYRVFNENAVKEIMVRARPNDFLLCPFGTGHQEIAKHFPDMIVVESGIGYPGGTFAPYRIFESYAIMHAYQGVGAAQTPSNDFWYDHVIPNSFYPGEFEFQPSKEDYFLFLGRINSGKGIHIAKQIAEVTSTRLIVAGSGTMEQLVGDSSLIAPFGVAGPEERRVLLSNAKAVICASTFLEPFCGVQIEAMLSGTPVISADRGAFAEYNLHGRTGFRCRTFEQFEWAARHIRTINPQDCRDHGLHFSNAAIAPMYTDYFQSVLNVKSGKGWYEPGDRASLLTSSWGSN